MSLPTLYSGPGQVTSVFAGTTYALQAEGENGQVKLQIDEKRTERSSALYGYHRSTLDDQKVKLSATPFDCWALLPFLFPNYMGFATAGGTTSGYIGGARPHDIAGGGVGAEAVTQVWVPDLRLYSINRCALTSLRPLS